MMKNRRKIPNENKHHRTIWHALKCSIMDFSTHTSIHGVKYICEDDRRLFERMFWVVIIVVGYATAGFLVLSIYNRYTATNMILENTNYPTGKLPFPAITICNNNRIQRTSAQQLANNLFLPSHISPEWVLEGLKGLIQLSNPELPASADFEILQAILNSNGVSIQDVMRNLTQPCGEMLERCSWQNQIVNCTKFFETSRSHLGYCCSFNYAMTPDASAASSSVAGGDNVQVPIHTRLYGQLMGLTILINPAVDDYHASNFLSDGVIVLIHDSFAFPGEQIIMKMVPVNKEVLIPIRMAKRVCTEDVADLPLSSRECLFPYESHLEFFPNYLDTNCWTECRMNYTLHNCGCIPYTYPDNGNHRICDLSDATCLYNNFELLHSFKPGVAKDLKSVVIGHESNLEAAISANNSMKCECLSQCEGISYETRVSWGDFRAAQDSVNQLFGPETNDTNRTLLHVYLESNFSPVHKRDLAIRKSIIMGILGGISSLFLGWSLITPIELTYFCSIRLPGFIKNDKQAGPQCPATPKSIRNSISYPESAIPSISFPMDFRPRFIKIAPSDFVFD